MVSNLRKISAEFRRHLAAQGLTPAVGLWVLAILLLGSSITLVAVNLLNRNAVEHATEGFVAETDLATRQLQAAIDQKIALMYTLQGLFESFSGMTRAQFRQFVEESQVTSNFPNTQALSWVERVAVEETSAFERRVRQDDSVQAGGYPEFTVRPAKVENERYIVTYTEPMLGNEGAFGFDIGSDPVRRQAIEQARDSDDVVASAPIPLIMESGNRRGILLMMPVYDGEISKGESTDVRQKYFRGLVVAVVRVDDLISSSGEWNFSRVSVHDITDYRSVSFPASTESQADIGAQDEYVLGDPVFLRELAQIGDEAMTAHKQVTIGGRTWQLAFTQSRDILMMNSFVNRLLIPILCALSTVLAAVLIGFLASAHQRSRHTAESLTADLQQANDELRNANREFEQFAHMASHDLQIPVRNVLLLVDMLEDLITDQQLDGELDARTARCLQNIRESGTRMQSLVRDLLAYAEGSQAQQLQPVDLNRTLDQVVEATRYQCDNLGARVDVSPLPTVLGDDQQLQRVFTNLVSNALKYAHDGQAPTVQIAANENGGEHEIRVRDNGIGIDAKQHASIFEPFKRLHRQDEIAGTGLGLAICRQIVAHHGGEIDIEESSADGTTILIRLPLAA